MKKRIILQAMVLILGVLAISKISLAQEMTFDVNLPGVRISIGDAYPNVLQERHVIYYEPLPEGRYYYDRDNDAFYTTEGNVYYYPSNVQYQRDNGKHKGWYKKGNKHSKRNNQHERERRDDDN
jgi:hypothetical protein